MAYLHHNQLAELTQYILLAVFFAQYLILLFVLPKIPLTWAKPFCMRTVYGMTAALTTASEHSKSSCVPGTLSEPLWKTPLPQNLHLHTPWNHTSNQRNHCPLQGLKPPTASEHPKTLHRQTSRSCRGIICPTETAVHCRDLNHHTLPDSPKTLQLCQLSGRSCGSAEAKMLSTVGTQTANLIEPTTRLH